ncbi:MAG: hypothetical protein AAF939_07030 [Planctomycetota bacterium]
MNSAQLHSKPSRSNPRHVLEGIGARQAIHFESESDQQLEQEPVQTAQILRLARQPEDDEHFVESNMESSLQIQQLSVKLNQFEESLQQRQKQFHIEIDQWKLSVQKQQKAIDIKLAQVKQHQSQVRCQQKWLMQLQSDIVVSYENAKVAIEKLVTHSGNDVQTVSQLKALKHEIFDRFNYISRRWNQLHRQMQATSDQQQCEKEFDDRVDWLA